jgi:hypothetical protein
MARTLKQNGRAYIASTWCNIFIKIQSITRYTIDRITKEYNRFYEHITSTECNGGPRSKPLHQSEVRVGLAMIDC